MMNIEKQYIRKRIIKTSLKVLLLLSAYFIFIKSTGIHISCPFRLITGFKCPGCGITGMFLNISELNFKAAFNSNPLVFCMLIPALILFFIKVIFMPEWLESENRIFKIIITGCIIIFILYGILRNILF